MSSVITSAVEHPRPEPYAPDPRDTPGAILRQGRQVGRNILLQLGPHPEMSDPQVGTMDTSELTALVVHSVNAYLHGNS